MNLGVVHQYMPLTIYLSEDMTGKHEAEWKTGRKRWGLVTQRHWLKKDCGAIVQLSK
jgi:hypothetical protein